VSQSFANGRSLFQSRRWTMIMVAVVTLLFLAVFVSGATVHAGSVVVLLTMASLTPAAHGKSQGDR